MAKQDSNPPQWDASMSDGCSGVFNLWFKKACVNHDEKYHVGGNLEDKMKADDEFYNDMCDPEVSGWFGSWVGRHGMARERFIGVRLTTYNYPPGHVDRSGRKYVEAFNWLGPGPQR